MRRVLVSGVATTGTREEDHKPRTAVREEVQSPISSGSDSRLPPGLFASGRRHDDRTGLSPRVLSVITRIRIVDLLGFAVCNAIIIRPRAEANHDPLLN